VASLLKLAKARKTTCEYSNRKISPGQLTSILDAGRWAPSSLNMQPWRFVVVRKRKAIDAIMSAAYYGLFHTSPPVIVCIVVPREFTLHESHRGVKNNLLGHDEALLNPGMPVLLMSLAAEEKGIGSCILTLDEGRVSRLLGMRKGDRVPIAVGIGYGIKGRACGGFTHTRHPLSKFVHNERLKEVKND
jgi:nitroreductase